MRHTAHPLVSIGVPVFNGAQFLSRALDSLLAQDWPAVEIIVSDNGSSDRSADIAEAYAARDARVRLLRSAVNEGFSTNFTRVLGASSGEYFMWAACDDWWSPAFVRRMVDAIEATQSAVVALSAVERFDESGGLVDVVRYERETDPSAMTPWQLTMQLAAGRPYHLFVYGLFRAAFLKRAFSGFAPVIAADRLFMCRVAMAGRFAYVDEILHRRLVRKNSIAERYADEAIGRLWQASAPRWRLALMAGPYLWRSPVLPRSRRLWVPAVVARFVRWTLANIVVSAGWMRHGNIAARYYRRR